ncbi:MAG: integrase arm-type DNA-binding domain-containing protein, partial [Pseudomonadota bacterium]
MARSLNKLTAMTVKAVSTPGLLSDGGGLYLQSTVGRSGVINSSWVLRYQSPNGRRREMGLGRLTEVSLAQARVKAEEARKLVREGVDPIEKREADRFQLEQAASCSRTFKQCAEAYIEAHEPSWRNAKHRQQWRNTLAEYVFPRFGPKDVAEVDLSDVLEVLEPIWTKKNETASRLRGRIENVLDWAAVQNLRPADNPARWRGNLQHLLPARAGVHKVEHHPSMPYADAPAFYRRLLESDASGAQALRLLMLTALRTNEVLGARWGELDLEKAEWKVPAERMKMNVGHRLPLSEPALGLLSHRREHGSSCFHAL